MYVHSPPRVTASTLERTSLALSERGKAAESHLNPARGPLIVFH